MTAVSIDDMRRLMREAVGAKLADTELSRELRLADTGITSLDLVEVVFAVEDHLGVELPPVERDPETFGDLLDYVNRLAADLG